MVRVGGLGLRVAGRKDQAGVSRGGDEVGAVVAVGAPLGFVSCVEEVVGLADGSSGVVGDAVGLGGHRGPCRSVYPHLTTVYGHPSRVGGEW